MYGYQTSYPEDLQYYMQVKKYEDEFDKYNPARKPVDEDEEEAADNIKHNEKMELKDIEYGKKLEHLQMNPIMLNESTASMGDIFGEKTAGKGE